MADPAATVLDEDFPDVPLAEEIACIRRELAMRQHVYAGWVERGKMTQAKADRELRVMRAVLKRLLLAEHAARHTGENG